MPTYPCNKAPPEWNCTLDVAVNAFHQHILHLYAESSKGVLNKMFYMETYQQLRASHQNALPPEYKGNFPPRPKFNAGSPAPLIMWPRTDADDEPIWPQNGTPRTVVFRPVFND